ncbi:hypothetical protein [Pedobacter agri]|uniref:Uncharacterized protein n=1 Tax=Pedobacter agri TaxID=454586 RepID=A0A9X3I7Z6_9SPHI|nr:hypothetical protein [Pedobacter agri]MCX3264221.1 hypothetical protein [Pedobacter agri]
MERAPIYLKYPLKYRETNFNFVAIKGAVRHEATKPHANKLNPLVCGCAASDQDVSVWSPAELSFSYRHFPPLFWA